jgi:hypothetical protein
MEGVVTYSKADIHPQLLSRGWFYFSHPLIPKSFSSPAVDFTTFGTFSNFQQCLCW